MGFPTSLFVKSVDPNLICGICSGVLDTPTLTPCGHTFCQSCINTWLDTASIESCPECRSFIDKDSMRPILSLRNFISSLEVGCPNKSRGCQEVMSVDSQETHQNICQHTSVVCTACNELMDKCQLADHEQECIILQSINDQIDSDADTRKSESASEKDPRSDVENESDESSRSVPSPRSTLSRVTHQNNITTTTDSNYERAHDDGSSTHVEYLLYRINTLERQVARLLDDLQDAHRKNSHLYFQNRQLKLHDIERHQIKTNMNTSYNSYPRNTDTNSNRFESRRDCISAYSVSCQKDIAKLSLHIARYLLQKPSSVDSDRVFQAIRRCYQLQFNPTTSTNDSKIDHDIHMLLATAYSSNWFSGPQRMLLGCWLQCTLRCQEETSR